MNKEVLKKQLSDVVDQIDFDENKILLEIIDVLKNYRGDDFECVERIVSILEEKGYDCGNCHDF